MPGSGTVHDVKGDTPNRPARRPRAVDLAVRWLLPVSLAGVMWVLDQLGVLPRLYLDSAEFYSGGAGAQHVGTVTAVLTVLTCAWAMADLVMRSRQPRTPVLHPSTSVHADNPATVRPAPAARAGMVPSPAAPVRGGSLVMTLVGRTVQLIMTGVFLAVVFTLAAGAS